MENHDKEMFLRTLKAMVGGMYEILKEYSMIAVENKAHVEGYMRAGLTVKLVSREELESVLEKENHAVFGMTIAERKKRIKEKIVSIKDYEYLEIPAIMRRNVPVG